MNNKIRKEFLQRMLKSNDVWATRALMLVADNQTNNELVGRHTEEKNSVGFNKIDAPILTRIMEKVKSGTVTSEDINIVRMKTPKYWRQVLSSTNLEKLDKMIGKVC